MKVFAQRAAGHERWGMFDGIAELANGGYSAVLAAAEPIERRPEAAVRTLASTCGPAASDALWVIPLDHSAAKCSTLVWMIISSHPVAPKSFSRCSGAAPLRLSGAR